MTRNRAETDRVSSELAAAEVLLRSLPDDPTAAWLHLERAGRLLGVERAADGTSRETDGGHDLDAAWARLGELRRHVARTYRDRGPRIWWPVAVVVVAVTAAVAVAVSIPAGGPVIEVGQGRVGGGSPSQGPTVTIDAQTRLVIHLGSAWHVSSLGLTVRHGLPCRLTLVRRGRPQWSTELAGGDGSAAYRYVVEVPVRAQRRGFEQLVITPDPGDGDVEVGGLRLKPS